MKVLVLDLETAPHVAHVWGLFDQTVGLSQLIESGYVLGVGAKWEGDPKVYFHKGPNMAAKVHKMLDDADVVVGFNHVQFDLRHLRTEFVKAGLTPPSPWTDIDLLRVVRANFKFASNKLAYVSQELLGDAKAPTGGHQLWIDVMANKRDAWKRMEAYCVQDVLLTERLYQYLKPWIKLPNPALYGAADVGPVTCPGCGSNDVRKRGLAYTALQSYQRYQCTPCGRWSRGKRAIAGVDARAV